MLFEPAEPLPERVLQAMVGAELAAHIAHRLARVLNLITHTHQAAFEPAMGLVEAE